MKKKAVLDLRNARVLIVEHKNYWFAQCIDIDYSAQGSSLEEVRDNFEKGFIASVRANLDTFGNLDSFLTPPPFSVRESLFDHLEHTFSVIAEHHIEENIPTYETFQYIQQDDAIVA